MTVLPRIPSITTADADHLVTAALDIGAARCLSLSVAVVDVTGEVVVLKRSDTAMPLTSRVCVAKARTALLTLQPSRELGALPGPIVDSIRVMYSGDFVPCAGGVVITHDNIVVGAIGASGALADQDEDVARSAIAS